VTIDAFYSFTALISFIAALIAVITYLIRKYKEYRRIPDISNETAKKAKRKNTSLPVDNQISTDKKKEIMNRVLSNGIATCWWIIERSEEKLGKEKAIQATPMWQSSHST